MTELVEAETLSPVADVIALIDSRLPALTSRELVSADEVSDLLLDMRMLLATVPPS
jgi:hypothetical protein